MVDLHANHIAPQTGGFEPARSNHFSLELDIPNWDKVRLALNNVKAPSETSEEIEINFGNEVRYVAGKTTFEEIPLVINDYVDEEVAKTLADWRKLVYDAETGGVGYASEYKVSGAFLALDPKGEVVQEWPLVGCWPKIFDLGERSHDDSTQVKINVTIRYDKVSPPVFGGGGGQQQGQQQQ